MSKTGMFSFEDGATGEFNEYPVEVYSKKDLAKAGAPSELKKVLNNAIKRYGDKCTGVVHHTNSGKVKPCNYDVAVAALLD